MAIGHQNSSQIPLGRTINNQQNHKHPWPRTSLYIAPPSISPDITPPPA